MHQPDGSPLSTYNSLLDKNLSGYFANTRMRKHLVRSGLITRDGHITNENSYRMKMAKKEHRKQVRDMLANAIVEKALDMERMRQHEIRKKLDDLYKIELVQKVRSERGLKTKDDLVAILSPRHKKSGRKKAKSAAVTNSERDFTRLPDIHFDERNRHFYSDNPGSSTVMSDDEMTAVKAYNHHPIPPSQRRPQQMMFNAKPHPPPVKKKKSKKKRKLHRGLVLSQSNHLIAHRVQLQSMAEVTMKFLGSSLNLASDMFPANKLSEVQVIQQHCGGSTICVFRELLPPNTLFTFVSRRHRGSPFGLTINLNGVCNTRISSCCEYKHTPGNKIGGKNSQFALMQVQGASPCYKCQIRLGLNDSQSASIKHEEPSSDEDAAAQSFDVIVSRAEKRPEDHKLKNRPASANVGTQTSDELTKDEEYLDEFEQEEDVEVINDEMPSEESSESDGDDDDGKHINNSSSSSDTSSSSDSESENEKIKSDKENESGDESGKDDIVLNEDEMEHNDDIAVKEKGVVEDKEKDSSDENSVDNASDVEKNESASDSDTSDIVQDEKTTEKSDDEIDSAEKSDEEKDSVKKSDDEKDTSEKSDDEKDTSEKSDEEKDTSEKSDSEKSNSIKSDEETEKSDIEIVAATNDEDKNYTSVDLRDENKNEEKENDSDNESVSSKSSSSSSKHSSSDDESDEEKDETVDKKESLEESFNEIDTKEEEAANEEVARIIESDADDNMVDTMPSCISRESTMLTGNEDGRCDSENKTIQFNEEVDVVHYEKVDVNGEEVTTPRSDDDTEDSDLDINHVSNNIVLASLDDDAMLSVDGNNDTLSDDDSDEKKRSDDEVVLSDSGDVALENDEAIFSDASDTKYFDEGNDPDNLGENMDDATGKSNDEVEERLSRPGSVKELIEDWKDVDLHDTILSPEQTNEFVMSLDDDGHGIESLSLRNSVIDGGIEKLKEALKAAPNLKALNLSSINMNSSDCQHLAEIITDGQHKLETLILHGNPISDDGIATLTKALSNNTTIRILDIGHCEISDTGIRSLRDYISEQCPLEELTLSSNVFTEEGWNEIAHILKVTNHLTVLSIDGNKMGDVACRILCDGVKENNTLLSIDLENNELTDGVVEDLSDAIKKCTTIQDLTLKPNLFSSEGEQKLRQILLDRVKTTATATDQS